MIVRFCQRYYEDVGTSIWMLKYNIRFMLTINYEMFQFVFYIINVNLSSFSSFLFLCLFFVQYVPKYTSVRFTQIHLHIKFSKNVTKNGQIVCIQSMLRVIFLNFIDIFNFSQELEKKYFRCIKKWPMNKWWPKLYPLETERICKAQNKYRELNLQKHDKSKIISQAHNHIIKSKKILTNIFGALFK